MMTAAACAVLFTVAATASAADPPATRPTPLTLSDLSSGDRRVLVVMASSGDDASFIQQRQTDRDHAADYTERDIKIVYVTGDDATADGKPLPAGTAAGLRRGLGGDAFVVLLVGKDRGIKLRETRPVTAERLIALIDGMPMRQREAAGRK